LEYKKIIITKRGGKEKLKLIKEPKENLYKNLNKKEAIIKILASGVAYADIMMREGTYPGHPPYPFTPGYDIIGIIEEISENKENLKKGDIVAALTVTGGYSEYIVLPTEKLIPITNVDPNNQMELAKLVSMVLNYITAYQMLSRIKKLNQEDYILIHGGGGGVGTALLQLIHHYDFKNVYTTISRRKSEIISKYNAKPIYYQEESFVDYCKKHKIKMDLILDPIGGWHFLESYKVLNRNGTLVLYGTYNFLKEGTIKSMLGVPLTYLRNLFDFNKKVIFYLIGQKRFGGYESIKNDYKILLELFKNKKIDPLVEILPFSEKNVQEAHQRLQNGEVLGKIVLIFDH